MLTLNNHTGLDLNAQYSDLFIGSLITEVEQMLPLITPYTMPTDQTEKEIIYHLADKKIQRDGLTTADDSVLTEAICYYIAHLFSLKDGSSNMATESLGDWSVSYINYKNVGQSKWIDMYNTIVKDIVMSALIATPCTAVIDDTTMKHEYPIDAVRGID